MKVYSKIKDANPWDEMPDFYNTYKDQVWFGAEDNIKSVWPVLISLIKNEITNPFNELALDFGCGSGMFCEELKKLGFTAKGIDLSPNLISIGKENITNDIELLVGDASTAKQISVSQGMFKLITSIMVLPFIKNEEIIQLANTIQKNGYLMFANHNPNRLAEKGVTNLLPFSDTDIVVSIYPRTSDDYDNLLDDLGFVKVFDKYQNRSDRYVEGYEVKDSSKNPKYHIMAYKRSGAHIVK